MGDKTSIPYVHHTFNPWWGCEKITPECANCYAETIANRFFSGLWGKDSRRRFFGYKHWQQPHKWNGEAVKVGEQRRVLCGSMCDWLEDRPDLLLRRLDLTQKLIPSDLQLTWLLLTKRMQNWKKLVPEQWLLGDVPDNVWFGVSAGCQDTWDKSIPGLLKVKERTGNLCFVSVEPMIGPVDILNDLWMTVPLIKGDEPEVPSLSWLIFGGESGAKARPLDLQWIRDCIDQVKSSPFLSEYIKIYVKQLGTVYAKQQGIYDIDSHAANMDYWPDDLKIRQIPERIVQHGSLSK